MKILHIDETFHPSFGYHTNPLAKYQAKIGDDIVILTVDEDNLYPVFKEFSKKEEISLFELDKMYESENNVKIIRMPVKCYLSNRAIYKNSIFKKIDEINPDIIYVHLLESYISIRMLLKFSKKYPLVFDSHMLEVASKNPFKKIYEVFFQTILARIIEKNKFKVIRTQDDDYIIRKLGINRELAPFISFGTDTYHFKYSEENKRKMRKEYEIPLDAFVFIYTGKITKDKGLDLLANGISKRFEETGKEVYFVIVGNSSGEFGDLVEEKFKESENKIIRIPVQNYLDLPLYYQMSDFAIFPKQNSMSFFDAQACGLPVLLEDNKLNVKRVSYNNGCTYKKNSVSNLREKLLEIINMDIDSINVMKKNSIKITQENYSYKRIVSEYNEIIYKEYYRQSKIGCKNENKK